MLQHCLGLLAAGFEEEAAGFFVDCFEIDAGQRVEWRKRRRINAFHASTSCAVCLWRREEIVGWCLAWLTVCSRDFLLLLVVVGD